MKRLITIALFFAGISLQAQISPGDLTEAHKDLEGMSNCTKCHEIGEAVTNQKCLDCHTEIQTLINVNRGYHSSSEVQSKQCVECHNEHHGRKFEISRFDRDNFNHFLTTFELTGKHKPLKCDKCHNEKLIADPEIKKRSGTFLGLGITCADCHEDYHQGTLSENCRSCHNTDSFRPAPLFDHNTSKYKLTGSHLKVDCVKCHVKETRNGKDFQVFTGLRFSSCMNCHKDIHEGKLGNNCESCHSTDSFHKIENEKKFDHSKTGFDLIGKHQETKCEDCHTTNFKRVARYSNCIDCHRDYHNGELKKSGQKYDCKSCHSERGFIPSLYSIDDHNMSQYKLTGSHLAVPCIMCHKKDDRWTFRLDFAACSSCHENIHGTSISKKFMHDDNCSDCHETNSWKSVTFDHNSTKFQLKDKHAKVECRECHDINRTDKVSNFVFANLSTDCESCHQDPHFNQFVMDGKTDCSRCHAFKDWQPVEFNHARTKFPLKGAHAKAACEKCHIKKVMAAGTFVKYRFRNTECITCHVQGISNELNSNKQ